MDWIVTTARTVEEAQTRALDLLGVDAADAEVQVVEEGKTGLFGRTKTEARVRARIKPMAPPVKEERRPRGDSRNRNRSSNKGGGGSNRGGQKSGNSNRGGSNRGGQKSGGGSRSDSGGGGNRSNQGGSNKGDGGGSRNRRSRSRSGSGGRSAAAGAAAGGSRGRDRSNIDREDRPEMPVDEQRTTFANFVLGVAKEFDSTASVELVEEGTTLTAKVTGEDLGRLIGPKASVLQALEELSRTAMHRAAEGRRYHRIRVDVDGYRERRQEALERFAAQTAERAISSGEPVALEPMGAADRKIVHDVVGDIDGVESGSEGRDPRRYIVITPTGGGAVDEEE